MTNRNNQLNNGRILQQIGRILRTGKSKMTETMESPKIGELVYIDTNKTVRVEYVTGYRPGSIFVIVDYRGAERCIRRMTNGNWGNYGTTA
jgi:hypothetical protein